MSESNTMRVAFLSYANIRVFTDISPESRRDSIPTAPTQEANLRSQLNLFDFNFLEIVFCFFTTTILWSKNPKAPLNVSKHKKAVQHMWGVIFGVLHTKFCGTLEVWGVFLVFGPQRVFVKKQNQTSKKTNLEKVKPRTELLYQRMPRFGGMPYQPQRDTSSESAIDKLIARHA